jgi:hypothetical protein
MKVIILDDRNIIDHKYDAKYSKGTLTFKKEPIFEGIPLLRSIPYVNELGAKKQDLPCDKSMCIRLEEVTAFYKLVGAEYVQITFGESKATDYNDFYDKTEKGVLIEQMMNKKPQKLGEQIEFILYLALIIFSVIGITNSIGGLNTHLSHLDNYANVTSNALTLTENALTYCVNSNHQILNLLTGATIKPTG